MQNESTSKGKEVSQRRSVSAMERKAFFGARNQHGQTPETGPETGQDDLLVGADRWSTAKVTSRTRRSSDITGLRATGLVHGGAVPGHEQEQIAWFRRAGMRSSRFRALPRGRQMWDKRK
ncbi:unnamed protein product [Boreogadus saida]